MILRRVFVACSCDGMALRMGGKEGTTCERMSMIHDEYCPPNRRLLGARVDYRWEASSRPPAHAILILQIFEASKKGHGRRSGVKFQE
jgi:hypothetical protein